MIPRSLALSALTLASAAGAQSPFTTSTTVTYTLGFAEIGGNANGTLEPGESALIQISVAFSRQNAVVSFAPPAFGYSSGTIRGIGMCFVDLIGSTPGAWDLDYIHPGQGPILDGWDVSGAWGTPTSGGSNVTGIVFGQFPLEPWTIHTTNPINLIWQALWTPADYTPRIANLRLTGSNPHPSSVSFRLGSLSTAIVGCRSTFDTINIAVVPSPSSALILAACTPALGRRRRSRPC